MPHTAASPSSLSDTAAEGVLHGLRAVSLAGNIPGPVAAAMLQAEGMHITKIEGPHGDMMVREAPGMYAEMNRGQTVLQLNLREPEGQAAFHDLLAQSDLLITSHRRAALARLGITREALAERHPHLCWVEIVGDCDAPEAAGHDLTYQMQAGLVAPPHMPLTLLADLAGAHEAARAAITLLLARERGHASRRHRCVGLKQAAETLNAPVRHGLTTPGGWLSGQADNYRLYPLKDGWAAVATLEPHFAQRLDALLEGRPLPEVLAGWTVAHCNALAQEHDLPVAAAVAPKMTQ